jgi:hypothetical protein
MDATSRVISWRIVAEISLPVTPHERETRAKAIAETMCSTAKNLPAIQRRQ